MAISIVCFTGKEEAERIRKIVDEVAKKRGFSVTEDRFNDEDYRTMLGLLGLLAQGYEDEDELD